MKFRILIKAVLIAFVLLAGGYAAQVASTTAADAASCSSACYSRYSSCLISKRNRSTCQAQYQRCMDGCISGRRRLGGPLPWLISPFRNDQTPPATSGATLKSSVKN